MKIIKRINGYAQDPTRHFNFSRFEKQYGDFILVEAAFEEHSLWKEYNLSAEELRKILKKKIVRLEFEDPNKFFIRDNPDHYDYQFYKIFTICPYTATWLNKRQGNKKHIPIFFPFNEKFIPKKYKKKYDIIYTGHILSNTIRKYANIISKFNYRLVSNSKNALVTNRSATYEDKMHLIAQSRIALISNLLYLRPYHLLNLWLTPDYKNNEAFKLVPKWFEISKWLNKEIVAPQLKSRLFEAAFAKSLILCRKDSFNIIERFFEPAKEFVYFEEDSLEKTIEQILGNYDDYEKIIEKAYQRAISNYTTKSFAEKYLNI